MRLADPFPCTIGSSAGWEVGGGGGGGGGVVADEGEKGDIGRGRDGRAGQGGNDLPRSSAWLITPYVSIVSVSSSLC